jgi:PDZ domain-containing protein
LQMIGTWLKGSVKEWTIISLAVAAILGVTTLCVYPIYYEFDTPGEMIAMEDIGIHSSVHFVTVYSGVTETLLEHYNSVLQYGDETSFYRIDPYYSDYAYDWDSLWDYREETISHAFDLVLDSVEGTGIEAGEDLVSRMDEVLYQTEEYYGNSMGLMVAVALHEELFGYDYSAGGSYIIAGTGTIEADSTVGSIGALEQKLILAQREGVTHFFVPQDELWYGEESNELEAARVAKERGLAMQIIPVATLTDAISYLDDLVSNTNIDGVGL